MKSDPNVERPSSHNLLCIGAGASFGARQYPQQWASPPPLGKEVVQWLQKCMDVNSQLGATVVGKLFSCSTSGAGDIVGEARRLMRIAGLLGMSDYEKLADRLARMDECGQERLRHLNFVLGSMMSTPPSPTLLPRGWPFEAAVDGYDELFANLGIGNDGSSKWTIMSLNYDTLAEQAAARVLEGISIENCYWEPDASAPNQRINFLKPHGSWNWVSNVNKALKFHHDADVSETLPLLNASLVHGRTDDERVEDVSVVGDAEQPLPPIVVSKLSLADGVPEVVMAHYMEKKPSNYGSRWLEQVRIAAKRIAGRANNVIIVGMKLPPCRGKDDPPLYEILDNIPCKTPVTCVDPYRPESKLFRPNWHWEEGGLREYCQLLRKLPKGRFDGRQSLPTSL